MRNKIFIIQIWNRRLCFCASLYQMESMWKRGGSLRLITDSSLAWCISLSRLLGQSKVTITVKNSPELYVPAWKSKTCKSVTVWLRKVNVFFPQIELKTKSQLSSDWKLSPLLSGLNNSVVFFFCYEWCDVYIPEDHNLNRYLSMDL